MKKLLLLFAVAAVAMSNGCTVIMDKDYGCYWLYEIYNHTGSKIIYAGEVSAVVILPGETNEVYDRSTLCGKEYIPQDRHAPEELMLSPDHRLIIGDEFMPETVWRRDLWDFSAEPYRATYTLILTDELIENLKQSPN